jgi:hypothetical protein
MNGVSAKGKLSGRAEQSKKGHGHGARRRKKRSFGLVQAYAARNTERRSSEGRTPAAHIDASHGRGAMRRQRFKGLGRVTARRGGGNRGEGSAPQPTGVGLAWRFGLCGVCRSREAKQRRAGRFHSFSAVGI